MTKKKKVVPAKRKKSVVKVPKCLERTKKHKYTDDEIEEMKIAIFANIEGALIDDGEDEDWATDAAREEIEGMTVNQIINTYERDFKD